MSAGSICSGSVKHDREAELIIFSVRFSTATWCMASNTWRIFSSSSLDGCRGWNNMALRDIESSAHLQQWYGDCGAPNYEPCGSLLSLQQMLFIAKQGGGKPTLDHRAALLPEPTSRSISHSRAELPQTATKKIWIWRPASDQFRAQKPTPWYGTAAWIGAGKVSPLPRNDIMNSPRQQWRHNAGGQRDCGRWCH